MFTSAKSEVGEKPTLVVDPFYANTSPSVWPSTSPDLNPTDCYVEMDTNSRVLLMNAALVVSGSITTTIFTLMMECTRRVVVEGARATHYTILSTAEVLGKLVFSALGVASLTDALGYPLGFLLFLVLSLFPPVLLAFGRRRWIFLHYSHRE
nr:hypothetical transcript [Hymenolepis microstoma]